LREGEREALREKAGGEAFYSGVLETLDRCDQIMPFGYQVYRFLDYVIPCLDKNWLGLLMSFGRNLTFGLWPKPTYSLENSNTYFYYTI
jgi:hypothetical protein